MHVLLIPSWYVTHYSPTTGSFFHEQAHALRKNDVRVGVIYPDLRSLRTLGQGRLDRNAFRVTCEDDEGIVTLRWNGWKIPKFPRANRWLWMRWTLRLYEHYIQAAGRPDLVHAHSAIWAGAAAAEIKRRFGVPYVVTEHASAYGLGQIHARETKPIRTAFQNASQILTVSEALAGDIKHFTNARPVQVMPNLVDTSFFVPPPDTRSASPFRLLTVAYLHKKKAIDVLLCAYARALAQGVDGILEIGGDGLERIALTNLAKQLGIEDRVRFLGLLSRSQVREAMQRANVLILPSHVEPFGVVLIEAMATGLPVIASRAGGPQEFINPELGYLTIPGDETGLVKALQSVYDNYRLWQSRSQAIRSYVEMNFSETVVADRLKAVYADVVG